MKRVAIALAVAMLLGSVAAADVVNAPLLQAVRGSSWVWFDYNWNNITTPGSDASGALASNSFVKWDLSSVSGTVVSATMTMANHTAGSADGTNMQVGRYLKDWSPAFTAGVPWLTDQAGAAVDLTVDDPFRIYALAPEFTGSAITVDLTSYVQYWMAHPTENFGILMNDRQTPNGENYRMFWVDDFGSLTITTSAAVPEPGTLMLLGTGALGAFGLVRRRMMA